MPITYISTLTPVGTPGRVVVARRFDSFWTADACALPGERIFQVRGVGYATRDPRPGDALRMASDGGVLPPHANDDAAGNPTVRP